VDYETHLSHLTIAFLLYLHCSLWKLKKSRRLVHVLRRCFFSSRKMPKAPPVSGAGVYSFQNHLPSHWMSGVVLCVLQTTPTHSFNRHVRSWSPCPSNYISTRLCCSLLSLLLLYQIQFATALCAGTVPCTFQKAARSSR
jgi:hypothetical protein